MGQLGIHMALLERQKNEADANTTDGKAVLDAIERDLELAEKAKPLLEAHDGKETIGDTIKKLEEEEANVVNEILRYAYLE